MSLNIKVGDRFILKNGYDEYILAQIDLRQVCLISLSDGNRWSSPYKVMNPNAIDDQEWQFISNGRLKAMTLNEMKSADRRNLARACERVKELESALEQIRYHTNQVI